MKIDDFDTIALDLDETIWNGCHNTFWAKCLIQPLDLKDDMIIDSNLNFIKLQEGVKHFLSKYFYSKNIYFITRGGYLEVPFENQPGVICLRIFDILRFFKKGISLHYTHKKSDYFKEIGKTLFIDDDQAMLDEIKSKFPNVECLNRATFNKWTDLC